LLDLLHFSLIFLGNTNRFEPKSQLIKEEYSEKYWLSKP